MTTHIFDVSAKDVYRLAAPVTLLYTRSSAIVWTPVPGYQDYVVHEESVRLSTTSKEEVGTSRRLDVRRLQALPKMGYATRSSILLTPGKGC